MSLYDFFILIGMTGGYLLIIVGVVMIIRASIF